MVEMDQKGALERSKDENQPKVTGGFIFANVCKNGFLKIALGGTGSIYLSAIKSFVFCLFS